MIKLNAVKSTRFLSYFFPTFTYLLFFPLASYAATVSLSQTFLELNNFSHTPKDVGAFVDINAIAIADTDDGMVTVDTEFDTIFSADDSGVFAKSDTETKVVGRGNNYRGQGEISSQAIGVFDIQAQQEFSFDFRGFLNLENLFSPSGTETLETTGNAFLAIINNTNPEDLYFYDVFGGLTRNSDNQTIGNFFSTEQNGAFTINNSQSQSLFSNQQQTINYSFNGYFNQSFAVDTQLTVVAGTRNQSCVVNSSECVPVPENFGLPASLMSSALMMLFLVKKKVVKFLA